MQRIFRKADIIFLGFSCLWIFIACSIYKDSQKADRLSPPDTTIEQIFTIENSAAPFNVKVWTDKNRFQIGEPITFYLSADRDCYITLLDQGTSGTLRVLFPNPYQRDNFIHAGKTYPVPGLEAGYEIRVDGPPGIERVKVIASLNRSQLPVEISDRFYELSPRDGDRIRDLILSVKKMPDQQWTQGYLELHILAPEETETGHQRKLKPKRPDKPVDIIGTPGAIDRDD
ncbi:MAG: DUF4384 domain-containing protein [Nitrospirae bacterium]|nr:DUF4384 domain-containing protein [Nitrospirota bacterium]MBI5096814.1 DUF4384 domain-containing protein [Nitrospirota bacterium]